MNGRRLLVTWTAFGLATLLIASCQAESPPTDVGHATARPATATPAVGIELATRPPATPPPLPTLAATESAPAASTPTAAPSAREHRVSEGETLLAIALRYGLTLEELLASNPGLDPDLLQVGQAIVLPAAAGQPVADEGSSGPIEVAVEQYQQYTDAAGTGWLVGVVHNIGERAVQNVRVRFVVSDEEGRAAAEVEAVVPFGMLAPNVTAPFAVALPSPGSRPAAVALQSIHAEAAGGAAESVQFTFSEVRLARRGAGQWLSGTISNEGPAASRQTRIVAMLFDSQGRITGYNTRQLDGELAPGASRHFELMASPLGGDAVEVELLAEGVSAP